MAVRAAGLDAPGADVHFDALHDDQAHGEDQEGVGDGQGVQVPSGGVAFDQVAQQRPTGEQHDQKDQTQRRGLGHQGAVRLFFDGDGLAAIPAGDATQDPADGQNHPGVGAEGRMGHVRVLRRPPDAQADQRQDDGRHDPQQLRLQHALATILQQHHHQHDRDHEQRDQFFRRHVVSPQRQDAASPEAAVGTLAASVRAG
ncbi:hypothetical protein RM53_08915 [Brevundimonas nasdae]|uniref:Uncharacterized protein n=1 Tax=Brevundimonas nasdae TaxID=172043 RepID=A0A0B4D1W4_9CAUL|nr:hypothetical protein RM53_08915 [Brevundimonas nasdae]